MMNPPKFNQIDDMANMTFLSKASVLDNLCQHYTHMRTYDLKGQRAIAKQHGESLEDQIIQVNPALKTLDNDKTTRKKNSSRFGGTSPSLIGHWSVSFPRKLLREIITSSTGFSPRRNLNLLKLLLVPNPNHHWVHQGVIAADNTDDGEESLLTEVAFDVLGSSPEERICVSKLTLGIMHLGTVKFKQKPREEQAAVRNTEAVADKNAQLVGLNSGKLQRGITRCRRKAGNKLEQKGPLGAPLPEGGIWPAYHNITGWLEKNRDPLNEAVVGLLQKSSTSLLVLFKEEEAAGAAELADDHFAQHIVAFHPLRRSKGILTVCCRRYQSLNPSIIPPGFVDSKKASGLLLGSMDLGEKEYRIGYNKALTPGSNSLLSFNIFFCAGILATLDDMRDETLMKIMTMLQCHAYGFPMRIKYKNMLARRLGLPAIQRNAQKFLQLLFWGGWKLHSRLSDLKRDLERLEAMTKTKKEKHALDHRVTLTSDLSAQNDSVPKFQKEKWALKEVHQETAKDEENKMNHLTKKSSKPTTQMHELEDKWEQEKMIHGKAEKARHKAERDLKMTTGCQIPVDNTYLAPSQIQNCKREAGLLKLILELVEAALQVQATGSTLRRKHTEIQGERPAGNSSPNQQCSHGFSHQCKAEFSPLQWELTDTSKQLFAGGAEHCPPWLMEWASPSIKMRTLSTLRSFYSHPTLNSDAHVHKLDNLSEANAQLAEVEKSQAEIKAIRLHAENSQLSREHKEAKSRLNQIVHMKISLSLRADDFKRQLDEKSKSCTAAEVSLANAKHDLDSVKGYLEEEEDSKAELQCLVSKLNSEVTIWRTKYKTGATERTKKLEETKTKLAVRLQEAEETAESVKAWAANMEKTTKRLQKEVEDLTVGLEKANAACAALDKKQRAFDKMLAEWQQKCEELQVKCVVPRRMYTTENFELKTVYEESLEHLESMMKENKAFQEEIKDLINHLREGGRALMNCKRQRLEMDKDELQVALEEAEFSLEEPMLQIKLISIQLKLAQVKADINRRHEKEESETTRNNHQHATESLQASLETKVKGSAEALRLKTMGSHLTRMEMQLDHTNRNNSELLRTLNKLQQHADKLERMDEDACQHEEELQEQYMLLSPLQTELEEVQTGLEGSKHPCKLLEQTEVMERHNELKISLRTIKKLEPDLQHTTNEHEEIISEYAVDERAKQAVADIKELEIELDSKQKHHVETEILHKNKRPLKELVFTKDGHKINCIKKELEKMQTKMKTYKRQTEEAEQEASQSLAKYRKTIHEVDDAEEREGMAESSPDKHHTRPCVSASKGLTFGEII
ncbi:LOW QUALITY PROTEIN: uncharacterized protein MYH16 [Alca torda]